MITPQIKKSVIAFMVVLGTFITTLGLIRLGVFGEANRDALTGIAGAVTIVVFEVTLWLINRKKRT